jgi:hypothetical protein
VDVRIFAGGGGCTKFWWCGGGRAQRFFRLLRAEAARLVLKLRAQRELGRGGLPGHRRWAGMSLSVVAGRTWCYA